MQFQSLGHDPHAQCHVLTVGPVRLMLDCGLELTSFAVHRPPGDGSEGTSGDAPETGPCGGRMRVRAPCFEAFPVETIDAVLITNHMNMLALPFLTEYTGFAGSQLFQPPLLPLMDCPTPSPPPAAAIHPNAAKTALAGPVARPEVGTARAGARRVAQT